VEQKPARGNDIEVLRRAFTLLESMAGEEEGLALADLTRRSGYPKTTVYRIVRALEGLGYVRSVGDRPRFRVDGKVEELGAGGRFQSLRQAARGPMRALVAAFGETVNLGALFGGRVHLLEVIESEHSLRMGGTAGTHEPLHSTALGKAIAAYLESGELEAILNEHPLKAVTSRTITSLEAFQSELQRIRRKGFATDLGENVLGACCIAAPLFRTGHRVVGALSVSGPLTRLGPAVRRDVVREVLVACRTISGTLGA
jgi:IclR family transcriptional regulator, acetate operon repressor